MKHKRSNYLDYNINRMQKFRPRYLDYGVKGMKKGKHVMAREPEYVKRLKEGGGNSEPSAAPNANNREKLKNAAKIAAGVAGAAGLVGGAYLAHKYGLDKKLGNMSKGAASKAGDFALRGAGKVGANYLIAKHAAKGAARNLGRSVKGAAGNLGRSVKGAASKAGDFALRGAGKVGANYLIAKHAAKGAARNLGRSVKGMAERLGNAARSKRPGKTYGGALLTKPKSIRFSERLQEENRSAMRNHIARRGNSINATKGSKKSPKGTGWDVLRNRNTLKRALNNPNHVWDI